MLKKLAKTHIGVDEVGRGSLAGPVVACAFLCEESASLPAGIKDSKKLSKVKRVALNALLTKHYQYSIGISSVEEIDQINILEATKLAMLRALEGLGNIYAPVFFDGNVDPMQQAGRSHCIIGGDGQMQAIAAASIIAKEYRDQVIMQELHGQYPRYNWQQNAGYGTKEHRQAILTFGPTPHHRKLFISKYC